MPRHDADAAALRLAGAAVRHRLDAAHPDAAGRLARALPRLVTVPDRGRGRARQLLEALGVGARRTFRAESLGSAVAFALDPRRSGADGVATPAAYARLLDRGGAVISLEEKAAVAGELFGATPPAVTEGGVRRVDVASFVPWMAFRVTPRWVGTSALAGEVWCADTGGLPLVTAARGGCVVHVGSVLYDYGMREFDDYPAALLAESLVAEVLAVGEGDAAAIADAAGLRGTAVHVAWAAWLMTAGATLAEVLSRALATVERRA